MLGLGLQLTVPRGRAVAASPLLTGLVAYWKVEEASGTRNDAHGSNHLTDNNTVGSAAGKLGNAAQFVAANSEYLSIADNAGLSMGAGVRFTLAAWVYPDTTTAIQNIIAKRSSGAGSYEYFLRLDSTDARLYVSSDGSAIAFVATPTGIVAAGVWSLIFAWYDGANLNIQVNNGTIYQTAYTADVFNGTAPFLIGSFDTGASEFWNGRIDEPAIWKRVLTADERSQLWNGGAGKSYPF